MPGSSPADADVGVSRPLKVFFVSTSLGTTRRGIESFFRECFDAMHGYPGLHAELFKGGGKNAIDEHRLWCFRLNTWPAQLLGKLIRRNGYVIEQLSFLPSFIRRIRKGRPDVILYSDGNLAMRLFSWRKKIGVPYRMLFSNGGPSPPPFDGTDHVQQVTPAYYAMAIAAGEPPSKHSLVPYGIKVPAGDPAFDLAARQQLRKRLDLPVDRPIVLSVGWISRKLKRMDYLIDEIAALPEPRPFVMLLGSIDETSTPIIARAKEMLGDGNYAIRSVPYEQVGQYYQAADVFALASLKEGFGRVFLEAMIHGLPCVVNDHPIMRYVLGEEGYIGDFSKPGDLGRLVAERLREPPSPAAMAKRRDYVRQKFSWDVLRPAYFQMFMDCYRNGKSE